MSAWFLLGCSLAASPPETEEVAMAQARDEMVEAQLKGRDITDEAVLAAMGRVPRHRFIPRRAWPWAYGDHPVAIGWDQTISQPYIVAWMTQALGVVRGQKVLEIGTGSGYQAAVLSELGVEVFTIEIVPGRTEHADLALTDAGFPVASRDGVAREATGGARGALHLRTGDGYAGWPEHAPFDRILLTAAPPELPQPLLEQLAVGGRLIAPVGQVDEVQQLVIVERTDEGLVRREVMAVRFVPMTGEAQRSQNVGVP